MRLADWSAVARQVRWKYWVVVDEPGLLHIAVGEVTVELRARGRQRLLVGPVMLSFGRFDADDLDAAIGEVARAVLSGSAVA